MRRFSFQFVNVIERAQSEIDGEMDPFLNLEFLLTEKPQVPGIVAAIDEGKMEGGQIIFIHRRGGLVLGPGGHCKY
jgi:hypothetical protein